MTTVLVDHYMEGQGALLRGALADEGWLDLTPIEVVRFANVGLPRDSSDRAVWRFVQEQQMLLLTDNRNMEGDHSLELVMRQERTAASLPVLTIGSLDRIAEPEYRRRCAERLVDIVLDLPRYLGTTRIFIP